jgi:hypothetical protein
LYPPESDYYPTPHRLCPRLCASSGSSPPAPSPPARSGLIQNIDNGLLQMIKIIQIFSIFPAHAFHNPTPHLHIGGIVEIELEFSEMLLLERSIDDDPQFN